MTRIRTAFLSLFFVLTAFNTYGQTDILKLQIDSLKYINDDPFKCNSLTWRIIKSKKDAIQLLIFKLDDTTIVNSWNNCKGGNLVVGDLAYLTLWELFSIPFYELTGYQFDVIRNDCKTGLFEYLQTNRTEFKTIIQNYYDKRKANLKWTKIEKKYITPCQAKFKINGRYQ
jgi:hypothetical protein